MKRQNTETRFMKKHNEMTCGRSGKQMETPFSSLKEVVDRKSDMFFKVNSFDQLTFR